MVVYSLFNSVVLDLLLRHLLLVAGAAVVTVCIYYYVHRDDGEQTTADTEDTTVPEDPVYEQTTEPALVRHTEVVQDQMMEAVSEAEENIQELVVPKIQLEDRVKELEELLSEAHRSYDLKSKVILAEAEEKHQKYVKTITQLEEEKSGLEERVEALRDTLRKTKNLLNESKRKFDDMFNEQKRAREDCSILRAENMKMKMEEELLKVTLAEAEEQHQKDVETITQLEEEKSELTGRVEALRDTVEEMGKELLESNRECEELMIEREAHSILQSEVNEMKKIITQLKEQNSEMKITLIHKELLKVTRSKAEGQHQKDEETITQLEEENSELTEKEREAHSIVQSENNEMKKIITQLEEQNSEMKKTLIHKKQDQTLGSSESSTGSTSGSV
ncbi:golgin subfamily A member 6-like protein 22 isoform X2 [Tachysurus ichikawai]